MLADGFEVRSSAPPEVRVLLREPGLGLELLRGGDLAIAEAYADGRLDVEGELVHWVGSTFRAQAAREPRWGRLARHLLSPRPHRSSKRRARGNIEHHYDLGNEFYRLWLDTEMQYTCAYFPHPEATLEEAQRAKMDHVCRKLDLRPGERVVEAGCGWGHLALHMAHHYGVSVTAYNVSREQVEHARAEAERRGLADRVEFRLADYREIAGRYDAFVSVGMLEHVGKQSYRTLGEVIDRCLEPDGRGLLHFIGRARPQRMNPFTERHIFPGAYIPSLREALAVLEPFALATQDVENLRRHYAKTHEHWSDRFEKAIDEVRARFDERFVRIWRLYLASSLVAFREGSCELFQVSFARARCELPWTRAHLYRGDR